MNNLKLLKAQADLSMTQVDPKLRIGIERYIERLEELLRASELIITLLTLKTIGTDV